MLRIQDLALEIAAARRVVEGAPARIEEIEQRFRGRNAEYVALKDRLEEIEQDQRSRNAELTDLEETRRKYMNDLMQVKNQREYSATLKEIDAVKVRLSEHEDAILKSMEELESLKPKLEAFSSQIQEERQKVGEERAQVEAEVAAAQERVAAGLAERERIEGELPAELTDSLRRVEEMRQGLFLARLRDGMCQACYVRVRPQAAQEIRLATRIHACSQCRRFLYDEPSLRRPPAEQRDESGAAGIEALDGGAV